MLKKLASLTAIIAILMGAQNAFAAVEINSADQAQLDGVAGIGPATSRAILEERKKNGNFKDWADLEHRVRGIGEKNSVKLSAARRKSLAMLSICLPLDLDWINSSFSVMA